MAVASHLAGNAMSEALVLLGVVLAAVSGLPALLITRHSTLGQRVTTTLVATGDVLGLAGIAVFWARGDCRPIALPWPIPGGEFHVSIDGLSALFLLPVFLISLLGSIFGLSYWKQTDHPANGRKLGLFYGLLTAGMGLLLIARNSILFLFGWEIMALAAFFLVTTEDHDKDVRAAGWIYLVATHIATLCLFAIFALLRSVSGSFNLSVLNDSSLMPGMATAIFVLTLIGFGIKAGIMPLHVWLPSSHAIAPSHVSAIMSGVIIKMGIYGIVRITSLFPHPPLEWGGILIGLGAVSGVLGVVFAIGQHDLKRLLAYHSIENIGIIVIGIGLALAARSLGRADWIILGMSGALLHVWNHSFFKSLLFLSAGSVIHAVRTREIDRLGGLAKAMPRAAFCFLVGAVAICGLPPLNGFVSEFLIYLGLFATLGRDSRSSYALAALAAPALALIGALAVACFVKVFGAVFLGNARSASAAYAHDPGPSMLGPMTVLVACCFLIGVAPGLLAPVLGKALSAWAPELGHAAPRLTALAPLGWTSAMSLALLAVLALTSVLLRLRLKASVVTIGPTWGCGYVAPTPRMQYTSSSFAQILVDLFAWALRPQTHRPKSMGVFPKPTSFHSDVPDVALEEGVLPTFRLGAWLLSWLRVFQQGSIQSYFLYIFLALVALMLWR
jgi:hydrogenase-4 component B